MPVSQKSASIMAFITILLSLCHTQSFSAFISSAHYEPVGRVFESPRARLLFQALSGSSKTLSWVMVADGCARDVFGIVQFVYCLAVASWYEMSVGIDGDLNGVVTHLPLSRRRETPHSG